MVNEDYHSYSIRVKKYKSMNQELNYVPSFLLDKTFECSKCGYRFTPDWLIKRPPITPIKLLKKDLWATPITTYTPCPICDEKVSIDLPKGSFGKKFLFFADEAYRNFDTHYLVNYSIVGVAESDYYKLSSMVESWKDYIHHLNGGDRLGVTHLTDLWGGASRAKTKGAENLHKEDVITIYGNIAERIAKEPALKIYSCTALLVKDKKHFRKQLQKFKEYVVFNLLSISLMESTASGYRPNYHFEDDGKMGWLASLFERMRLTLMFPFLCSNTPISPPLLIRKNSANPLLSGIEIADIICFSSARTAHNLYNDMAIELDTELLGDVSYIRFNSDGDVSLVRQTGYPGIIGE